MMLTCYQRMTETYTHVQTIQDICQSALINSNTNFLILKFLADPQPWHQTSWTKWMVSPTNIGVGVVRMTTCSNGLMQISSRLHDTSQLLQDTPWSNMSMKNQTKLTLNASICWKKLLNFRKQMVLIISITLFWTLHPCPWWQESVFNFIIWRWCWSLSQRQKKIDIIVNLVKMLWYLCLC